MSTTTTSPIKVAVGAIGELNSGGPSMTVIKEKTEESSKLAVFAWFDGSTLHRDVFPKDAVKMTHAAPVKEKAAPAAAAAGTGE